MIITIDSREQNPLNFTVGGSVSRVDISGVPFGDYWCSYESGEEMPICFERKSISDLFGTLTSGHERFRRELQKAKDNGFKIILIVEGSISDVLAGASHSTVEGKTILKTMFTMWLKYDLVPVFCNNRAEMKRFILETFEGVGRNYKPVVPSAKALVREGVGTNGR